MTATLLVKFCPKPLRWPRCRVLVTWIAPLTGRAGGATGAGRGRLPMVDRDGFTDPAAVLANQASRSVARPMRGSDVRHVDHGVREAVAIEPLTAPARHQRHQNVVQIGIN